MGACLGRGPDVEQDMDDCIHRVAKRMELLRMQVETRVQLGKVDEALSIQQTLVRTAKTLGDSMVVSSYIDLAELMMEIGKTDKEKLSDAVDTLITAKATYEDIEDDAERDFGIHYRLYMTLAHSHFLLGERHPPRTHLRDFHWKTAGETYMRLAEEIIDLHGDSHETLIGTYDNLAHLAAEQENLSAAESYWLKAVCIKEGLDPNEGPETAAQMESSEGFIAVQKCVDDLRDNQLREAAAVKIQARYRGHRDRQLFKKIRQDVANLKENPFAARQKLPYCRQCGVEQGGTFCAGCGGKLVYR